MVNQSFSGRTRLKVSGNIPKITDFTDLELISTHI